MPLSDSLIKTVEEGSNLHPPTGPTQLGRFQTPSGKENAENVFVFVAHYDFKGGVPPWPRPGDKEDVQCLRDAFETKRNCRFREWLAPHKIDLLKLLSDETILKKYFNSDSEPSTFIFIILSHGYFDGMIFTETKIGDGPNDYDTFNTRDLFKSLETTFQKCLKFLFLGPCRGDLESFVIDTSPDRKQPESCCSNEKICCKISFEPNIHNLVIFYASVENTMARRDKFEGTWLVQCLIQELNEMKEDESVSHFLTAVQNRIHKKSIIDIVEVGQTPEFKIYPHNRKFKFSCIERMNCFTRSKFGTDATNPVQQPSNDFDWWDPQSKSVLRGKLAVIFHQGSLKNEVKILELDLRENLGFETKIVQIDSDHIKKYFDDLVKKSWREYGCFAAFFFANISESEDGQICIDLSRGEKKPIGELIQTLLGAEANDWIGKPKLFFLIDQRTVAADSVMFKEAKQIDFLKATVHSGWFVFILQNKDLLEKFLKIFEGEEIKGDKSLQESLSNLLIYQEMNTKEIPQAMMVSTLPHQLVFRQNFVKPDFRVQLDASAEEIDVNFKEIIRLANNKNQHRVWLLSSLPGSGKSTVMREITFELRRSLKGVKIFTIDLSRVCNIFSNAKVKKQKSPTCDSVIATATAKSQDDIENLIRSKRIIVMFDGFDEIYQKYRDEVLKFLLEMVGKSVPIWISTRPHEEETILKSLRNKGNVCRVSIRPLNKMQQRDFFQMISHQDEKKCEFQLDNLRKYGSNDILGNCFYLKMLAEIGVQAFTFELGLNDIYEKILEKKVSSTINSYNEVDYNEKFLSCKEKLEKLSVKYLQYDKVENVDSDVTNTGIVSLSNGNARFVHQTFAEFLAAGYYFDCPLKKEKVALIWTVNKMPFDIFKYEFRQVRKFLELKINETENPDQIENVKISITETIKKSQLIDVIVKENLLRLFSLLDDEITFEDSGRKGKFHFAKSDADEILINAWENSEDIAVRFLELGAYKNLTDCSSTAITRMFATVIKNNFANLFEKLNEQFYHTQFPFADPKLPHIGLSLSEFLFSKYTNEALYEALEFAAGENHHKILKYMIKKGVIDLSEEAASNTIQKAVDHNSVECVDLFVDYGFITSSLRLSGEKFNLDLSTAKALLKTTSALAAELAPRIFEFALGKCDFALAKYILEVDKTIAEATHFEDGMNALQVAASEKWSMNRTNASEMCRWLVNDLNFEIGFKDNKGWNALHHAADSINLYTVEFLVGKDPGIITSVTDKGENAAHLAANAGLGGGKVIKYLHSRDNQMIKQKTKKNRTVLHFAAAAKNELELYEWLIEKWVDLDAVDDEGLNVTHFAVNQFVGSLDLLIFLYNKNNELIKQKTNNDTTLLHFAAAREDNATKIISWLTDKGLDAADVDNRGWNALHFAASRGETRNLLFFLNGRPELVTALTKDGENVMHLLQNRVFGEFELQDLDYLIKKAHGLNKNLINQKTKSNKTVLHRVAETGFVKTFKRLVGLRLEVHAVDDQGWNVVHFAASGINVKVLEYIHENWPELKNTVTKDGENAMHLMSSNEKVNAKILKSFNGLGGELINQRTKTNKTVLHYAAQGGNDGVCRWLVEKMGLEVDAEDDNGWNAMHFASLTNDSFVTALFVYLHRICPGLIERRTKRNETTLHIAVKQRCVPKVTWLLHKGVDPATKDVDGKTALDLAHPEDVRALNRICGARAGQGDEEEPQLVSSSGEICTQSKDFLSPAD